MRDPTGHYAVLGVAPTATAEAISAAFRARARLLHPDVPETGDAAAFIRLREAYDVLAAPDRRAAYDRAAQEQEQEQERAESEIATAAAPGPAEIRVPPEAWRRPAGVSVGLWAGGALLAVGALAFGLGSVGETPRAPPPAAVPAEPPPPKFTNAAPAPRLPPAPVLTGTGTQGYVLPEGADAMLWRPAADGRYLPAGAVAPFTPVVIGRIDPTHGMAEVRLADGRSGFITARRLTAGTAEAAERAHCIYDAGPPPQNNDVLARHGGGTAGVRVENRRDQPAVVKLRDPTGAAVATAFVGPHAIAEIDGLPAGTYRPDVAYGDLWSQGCGRFVAGMRAQRFSSYRRVDERGRPGVNYVIPPGDGIDLSDEEFRRN